MKFDFDCGKTSKDDNNGSGGWHSPIASDSTISTASPPFRQWLGDATVSLRSRVLCIE
jgi:hypothetical protein